MKYCRLMWLQETFSVPQSKELYLLLEATVFRSFFFHTSFRKPNVIYEYKQNVEIGEKILQLN